MKQCYERYLLCLQSKQSELTTSISQLKQEVSINDQQHTLENEYKELNEKVKQLLEEAPKKENEFKEQQQLIKTNSIEIESITINFIEYTKIAFGKFIQKYPNKMYLKSYNNFEQLLDTYFKNQIIINENEKKLNELMKSNTNEISMDENVMNEIINDDQNEIQLPTNQIEDSEFDIEEEDDESSIEEDMFATEY